MIADIASLRAEFEAASRAKDAELLAARERADAAVDEARRLLLQLREAREREEAAEAAMAAADGEGAGGGRGERAAWRNEWVARAEAERKEAAEWHASEMAAVRLAMRTCVFSDFFMLVQSLNLFFICHSLCSTFFEFFDFSFLTQHQNIEIPCSTQPNPFTTKYVLPQLRARAAADRVDDRAAFEMHLQQVLTHDPCLA
jgi:hypothetical protein